MSVKSIRLNRNLTSDTRRNISPAPWNNFPIDGILSRAVDGVFVYDDFTDLGLAPTLTTEIGWGRYKAFANTGCTISKVSSINSTETLGGALKITLDTDNDSASIAQAYPTMQMSGSAPGVMVFEACYAQNSVVTNFASVFMGLGETELWTLANGVPLNGGDAITNAASALVFKIEEDGLGVVDTAYSDRATAFTDIEASVATLTAYTFKKFAIRYDPNAYDPDDCVQFFVDNVRTETRFTKSQLTALTNLDANAVGPIFAACADSAGTTYEGYLKWWAWGQVFEY